MENAALLRQELNFIRQTLQESKVAKSELQNKIKDYQKTIEERNVHVHVQLDDIVYTIELHIENTVMSNKCFHLRKKRLKEKLRLLCRIRNQLKYLQSILHIDSTCHVVEEPANIKMLKKSISAKELRAYYV